MKSKGTDQLVKEKGKWFIFNVCSCPFQCKKALKSILQKCTYLPGLEPLLYDAPSNILKHVVCQFSKVSE